MSTPRCPITGQPLPDGYYLHPAMRSRVEDLGKLIRYIPEAAEAVALDEVQPGARGEGIPSGKGRRLVNDRIWDDVQAMLDTISTWHTEFAQHLGEPALRFCAWQQFGMQVTENADRVIRWQQGPQMYDEVLYALRRCDRVTGVPRPRVYITCGHCEQGGYYLKVRSRARCVHCGVAIELDSRLASMWEDAVYSWLPRRDALDVAGIELGWQVTVRQLKHYCARGEVRQLGARAPYRYQPLEIIVTARRRRHA